MPGRGRAAEGRLGYKRAAEAGLAFPFGFRTGLFLASAPRNSPLSRRAARRAVRMALDDAAGDPGARQRRRQALAGIFSDRVEALVDEMLTDRLDRIKIGVDALRRRYPEYAAALEARFLRQIGAAGARSGDTSPLRRRADRGGGLSRSPRRRRGRARRRGPAPLRHRARLARADGAAGPVRRAGRQASRQYREAPQAAPRRAARIDRAERRPRRHGVLHRLGRGRGRAAPGVTCCLAAVTCSARWRSHRRAAGKRTSGADLQPPAGAAPGGFR